MKQINLHESLIQIMKYNFCIKCEIYLFASQLRIRTFLFFGRF